MADAARGPLLTEAEQDVVELLAEAMTIYARDVVGMGPSRAADLGEFGLHVHALQNAVLAQAAARAFPGRYRLAGESLAR